MNSPACVEGAFPPRLSRWTRLNVSFSGMAEFEQMMFPTNLRGGRFSRSNKLQSVVMIELQIAALADLSVDCLPTCSPGPSKECSAMKLPLKLAMPLLLCGLAACQLPPKPAPPSQDATHIAPANNAALTVRNNAFALLADLLNDEKNLSKILLIKFESPEVDRLVTDISKTADEGAHLLKDFSKNDPALTQTKLDLPPGEAATRDAIAKTKRQQLLRAKGKEFEFELLLTQVQALNYGAHLAAVIAANEPQPERAQQFLNLSAQFKKLYDGVIALVRTK